MQRRQLAKENTNSSGAVYVPSTLPPTSSSSSGFLLVGVGAATTINRAPASSGEISKGDERKSSTTNVTQIDNNQTNGDNRSHSRNIMNQHFTLFSSSNPTSSHNKPLLSDSLPPPPPPPSSSSPSVFSVSRAAALPILRAPSPSTSVPLSMVQGTVVAPPPAQEGGSLRRVASPSPTEPSAPSLSPPAGARVVNTVDISSTTRSSKSNSTVRGFSLAERSPSSPSSLTIINNDDSNLYHSNHHHQHVNGHERTTTTATTTVSNRSLPSAKSQLRATLSSAPSHSNIVLSTHKQTANKSNNTNINNSKNKNDDVPPVTGIHRGRDEMMQLVGSENASSAPADADSDKKSNEYKVSVMRPSVPPSYPNPIVFREGFALHKNTQNPDNMYTDVSLSNGERGGEAHAKPKDDHVLDLTTSCYMSPPPPRGPSLAGTASPHSPKRLLSLAGHNDEGYPYQEEEDQDRDSRDRGGAGASLELLGEEEGEVEGKEEKDVRHVYVHVSREEARAAILLAAGVHVKEGSEEGLRVQEELKNGLLGGTPAGSVFTPPAPTLNDSYFSDDSEPRVAFVSASSLSPNSTVVPSGTTEDNTTAVDHNSNNNDRDGALTDRKGSPLRRSSSREEGQQQHNLTTSAEDVFGIHDDQEADEVKRTGGLRSEEERDQRSLIDLGSDQQQLEEKEEEEQHHQHQWEESILAEAKAILQMDPSSSTYTSMRATSSPSAPPVSSSPSPAISKDVRQTNNNNNNKGAVTVYSIPPVPRRVPPSRAGLPPLAPPPPPSSFSSSSSPSIPSAHPLSPRTRASTTSTTAADKKNTSSTEFTTAAAVGGMVHNLTTGIGISKAHAACVTHDLKSEENARSPPHSSSANLLVNVSSPSSSSVVRIGSLLGATKVTKEGKKEGAIDIASVVDAARPKSLQQQIRSTTSTGGEIGNSNTLTHTPPHDEKVIESRKEISSSSSPLVRKESHPQTKKGDDEEGEETTSVDPHPRRNNTHVRTDDKTDRSKLFENDDHYDYDGDTNNNDDVKCQESSELSSSPSSHPPKTVSSSTIRNNSSPAQHEEALSIVRVETTSTVTATATTVAEAARLQREINKNIRIAMGLVDVVADPVKDDEQNEENHDEDDEHESATTTYSSDEYDGLHSPSIPFRFHNASPHTSARTNTNISTVMGSAAAPVDLLTSTTPPRGRKWSRRADQSSEVLLGSEAGGYDRNNLYPTAKASSFSSPSPSVYSSSSHPSPHSSSATRRSTRGGSSQGNNNNNNNNNNSSYYQQHYSSYGDASSSSSLLLAASLQWSGSQSRKRRFSSARRMAAVEDEVLRQLFEKKEEEENGGGAEVEEEEVRLESGEEHYDDDDDDDDGANHNNNDHFGQGDHFSAAAGGGIKSASELQSREESIRRVQSYSERGLLVQAYRNHHEREGEVDRDERSGLLVQAEMSDLLDGGRNRMAQIARLASNEDVIKKSRAAKGLDKPATPRGGGGGARSVSIANAERRQREERAKEEENRKKKVLEDAKAAEKRNRERERLILRSMAADAEKKKLIGEGEEGNHQGRGRARRSASALLEERARGNEKGSSRSSSQTVTNNRRRAVSSSNPSFRGASKVGGGAPKSSRTTRTNRSSTVFDRLSSLAAPAPRGNGNNRVGIGEMPQKVETDAEEKSPTPPRPFSLVQRSVERSNGHTDDEENNDNDHTRHISGGINNNRSKIVGSNNQPNRWVESDEKKGQRRRGAEEEEENAYISFPQQHIPVGREETLQQQSIRLRRLRIEAGLEAEEALDEEEEEEGDELDPSTTTTTTTTTGDHGDRSNSKRKKASLHRSASRNLSASPSRRRSSSSSSSSSNTNSISDDTQNTSNSDGDLRKNSQRRTRGRNRRKRTKSGDNEVEKEKRKMKKKDSLGDDYDSLGEGGTKRSNEGDKSKAKKKRTEEKTKLSKLLTLITEQAAKLLAAQQEEVRREAEDLLEWRRRSSLGIVGHHSYDVASASSRREKSDMRRDGEGNIETKNVFNRRVSGAPPPFDSDAQRYSYSLNHDQQQKQRQQQDLLPRLPQRSLVSSTAMSTVHAATQAAKQGNGQEAVAAVYASSSSPSATGPSTTLSNPPPLLRFFASSPFSISSTNSSKAAGGEGGVSRGGYIAGGTNLHIHQHQLQQHRILYGADELLSRREAGVRGGEQNSQQVVFIGNNSSGVRVNSSSAGGTPSPSPVPPTRPPQSTATASSASIVVYSQQPASATTSVDPRSAPPHLITITDNTVKSNGGVLSTTAKSSASTSDHNNTHKQQPSSFGLVELRSAPEHDAFAVSSTQDTNSNNEKETADKRSTHSTSSTTNKNDTNTHNETSDNNNNIVFVDSARVLNLHSAQSAASHYKANTIASISSATLLHHLLPPSRQTAQPQRTNTTSAAASTFSMRTASPTMAFPMPFDSTLSQNNTNTGEKSNNIPSSSSVSAPKAAGTTSNTTTRTVLRSSPSSPMKEGEGGREEGPLQKRGNNKKRIQIDDDKGVGQTANKSNEPSLSNEEVVVLQPSVYREEGEKEERRRSIGAFGRLEVDGDVVRANGDERSDSDDGRAAQKPTRTEVGKEENGKRDESDGNGDEDEFSVPNRRRHVDDGWSRHQQVQHSHRLHADPTVDEIVSFYEQKRQKEEREEPQQRGRRDPRKTNHPLSSSSSSPPRYRQGKVADGKKALSSSSLSPSPSRNTQADACSRLYETSPARLRFRHHSEEKALRAREQEREAEDRRRKAYEGQPTEAQLRLFEIAKAKQNSEKKAAEKEVAKMKERQQRMVEDNEESRAAGYYNLHRAVKGNSSTNASATNTRNRGHGVGGDDLGFIGNTTNLSFASFSSAVGAATVAATAVSDEQDITVIVGDRLYRDASAQRQRKAEHSLHFERDELAKTSPFRPRISAGAERIYKERLEEAERRRTREKLEAAERLAIIEGRRQGKDIVGPEGIEAFVSMKKEQRTASAAPRGVPAEVFQPDHGGYAGLFVGPRGDAARVLSTSEGILGNERSLQARLEYDAKVSRSPGDRGFIHQRGQYVYNY